MPTRSRASKNSYETQFKTNSDRDRDRDQKIPKKRKMKAYSTDLRQKIIDVYLQEKLSQRQLAERFCVALSFIQKLLKQYRTTG
jgi:transposase-like protein